MDWEWGGEGDKGDRVGKVGRGGQYSSMKGVGWVGLGRGGRVGVVVWCGVDGSSREVELKREPSDRHAAYALTLVSNGQCIYLL